MTCGNFTSTKRPFCLCNTEYKCIFVVSKSNKDMKKYIAYYRVSTRKQNLGIEAQRSTVMSYLSSIQDANLIAEYSEKESAKDNNRAQLKEALAKCKLYNATLIIAKLDRLSRNVSFIFALKDSNVDFIACDLPQFNSLTLAIFSGLAQQERELISSRTKAALIEKKKYMKLGSPSNLLSNMDKAIENSKLTRKVKALQNENNRKAFSLIRALKNNGKSWNSIAFQLNDSGFKTANNSSFSAIQVQRVYKMYAV